MARRPTSRYVSIEASEDESEYSSEDLDELPATQEPQRNWVRFTEELEQRYADVQDEEEPGEEEEVAEEVRQSQLVPRATSPKLFILRVKRGAEREILTRIIHNKSGICSVVCKDGLKGYLYVEAFQKQHVIDSLESLKGVSRDKISVVPQREMVEAMTYRAEESPGEWGRIKKGKYRNDLVQIMEAGGDMVKVKAIPRIEGERKLFRPEDHKDEAIVKAKGYCVYKRDMYIDGFLIKDILRSSVDFDVEPTFEELEEFKQRCPVSVGDKIRVTKGELIGTRGTVESIRGSMASVRRDGGLLEVQVSMLSKTYDVGEEVSYKDENGVVVKVEGGSCIVAIRDFTEEVRADANELNKPISNRSIAADAAIRQPRLVRDPYVNREVQIRAGDYKGYNGVVKDVYRNTCRVQLNSNLKFVNVPRADLALLERRRKAEFVDHDESYGTPGYKTPGYRTPGYRTPGYRTPGYKTPGYRTPGGMEETGTEWLVEENKPFKGALINADGRELVLEDIKNNLFTTSSGSFSSSEVSFVPPSKNDLVCVLEGEKKGVSGILIAINGDFGVIRSNNGPIMHLPMNQLSRKVY
jgi:transcription elongation factor SPT5